MIWPDLSTALILFAIAFCGTVAIFMFRRD